ncbi:unnamed protein product [Phytophthora fragariaefolia]|uniref:Unnamed protein product n=1 Tax=Phytophthora fragariaefolia TaxID=1490495 RepID=A0A9W6TK77_9STRA|nr:unnamed protein product [Phytophthora fragariaefolia]
MYAIAFAKRTRKSSGLQDSESDTDANIPATQLATPPSRDSATRDQYNRRHPNKLMPTRYQYAFMRYKCKLGCQQKSRGLGKRVLRNDRFLGCAGFRAEVMPSATSAVVKWVVAVTKEIWILSNENAIHNTDENDDFVDSKSQSYPQQSLVCSPSKLQWGLPFTTQKIRNLINSPLGSSSTEERLKDLIMAFLEEDGNSCLIIQDEWGLASGIVVQSAAQKEVFQRWVENLVLDWTHSTNNLGYYLGKQKVAQVCVAVLTLNAVATTSCREPDRYRANWQGCVCLRVATIDNFLSGLEEIGAVLNPYCFQRVQKQWDKRFGKMWSHLVVGPNDVYKSAMSTDNDTDVTWRISEPCMCNCLFCVSTGSPCRHIFAVIRHLDEVTFKVAQLQTRWSMKAAVTMEPLLHATVRRLDNLGKVQGDRIPPIRQAAIQWRIGYVKIKRDETCSQPVVSDCEQFNVVQAEQFPLIEAMQRLPSHEFYERFADLQRWLGEFRQKWHLTDSRNEVCEESDDILYSVATLDDDSVDDDPDEETTPYEQTSIRSDGLLKDLEQSEFMIEKMVWLVENPSQVTQDGLHFSEASQQALDGSVPSVSCVGVPAASVKLSATTQTTRQNSPTTASSGSLIQPSMLLAQVPTPEVAQIAACDIPKNNLRLVWISSSCILNDGQHRHPE